MERSVKRHRGRRAAVVAVLAGAFVAGTAASAFAITGSGSTGPLSTTGASLTSGYIYWNPNGVNHGAMEVSGYLNDTKGDSNSVYMKGKVEGYSYTTLWNNYNGHGTSVWGDYYVYDPQATESTYGNIGVCRNGITDNCTTQSETR